MIARWLLPFIFAAVGSLAQASQAVNLCIDDIDVYPWHMADIQGFSNRMLDRVSKQLAVKFEIETMPWKRCLALVEKGQIDGAIAASFRPERMSIGAYPLTAQNTIDTNRRMSDETYSFFVLQTKPRAIEWDGKHLANTSKPIAAQLGYSAVALLHELGVKVDDSDKRPELLLRKLLLEQVSAVVLNTRHGERLLKEPTFAGKIIRLDPPLQTREGYLLFSHTFARQHPSLIQRIWNEIAKVRESPAYKRELKTLLNERL